MPKSLALGNGKIFVGLDARAQVRDFYFPHVGLENHIGNRHVHRIGVFENGHISWFDDPAWQITIECGSDEFAGTTKAVHSEFGLEIELHDIVYNEKNIFLRHITVYNRQKHKREIKIFLGQEFQISESRRGDTGYYDPHSHTIIHYKSKRVFLVNAASLKERFDDYSIGIFQIEGKEGSFRDAEDGVLTKNPIEHGSVDSIMCMTLHIEGEGSSAFHYWVCVGESLDEVHTLNAYVVLKSPQYLMKTAGDYWIAWVNKQGFTFHGLSDSAVNLFKKSLFYIRAHTDNDGGILASGDSDMLYHGRDTYGYVWPRDGAFIALALDRAGYANVSHRFFSFCRDVVTKDGYFMHKYLPNKSLGSSWHPWLWHDKPELPIQEDETSLVLYALKKHYDKTKDLEFIEDLYNPLIKLSANFLVAFRDKKTGLSHPSYDVWEERFGISTFSCSVKYAALNAAGMIARVLGKSDDEALYVNAAVELREAILKHLYNRERGMFFRMISTKEGEQQFDATLDMGSIYGIYGFGVLPVDDKRVVDSITTIERELTLHEGTIGGVPRYEHDRYYDEDNDGVPNPWFITTLWLVKYYIARAQSEKDLEIVKDWFEWCVKHALSAGILSEQLHPFNGTQISASPLAWSHAEYVTTIIDYLEKSEELGLCIACIPKL
ncbi:MAG: glycoside hydrolase 15-like protein [Parcubacteria group bacterium Greene0416_14]|nr:MAG: glycoside hydrolase 15-like protein [Parcubacteria group bacterium Greene0416_14]TSD00726.1 MAG: glycoside hydrolase 15-like protein [Parcubacteria group bacterium Greene1014_15]TSD07848.1 MAG: glycoside hydrolase 15-like protein [Parcubacteria group bacterium Greene0714_4]